MSKFPPATRDDHEKFCHTEGWSKPRNATSGAVTHHVTYELALHDGRILRTRISRPVDRTAYGKQIWSHILRDQLEVDNAGFWACVREGLRPERGEPETPMAALPLSLVRQLIQTAGLDEQYVARMSKAEAVRALSDYYSQERTEGNAD